MASEEQINRQQRFNDLRQEELDYIRESQEFLGQTISLSAQLSDQISNQVSQIRNRINLDNQILKLSKANVDTIAKLKVDYQDIATVDKDRQNVLSQIQKNNNIIAAQSIGITKEAQKQADLYVKQENVLSGEQKILQDKIKKQEELKKAIESQEAAGIKVSIADKALLKNAQESTRLQRFKVANLQKELTETAKLVDPRAVSVSLLKEQNEQLEKAADYLDEEEDAIRKVIKGQALFNFTLGAAEGLLKKLGLSSAAISLGLDEGKAAAEELANKLSKGGEESLGLFDKFKVLGAGIVGTFKGMAKGLKTTILALAIGKLFGKIIGGLASPVTGFIKDLKSQFTSGISFIRDQFFSLQTYIDDANAGEKFLQQLSADTAAVATNIGVGTQEAKELVKQAGKVSASVGMLPEELAKTTAELNQAFGTTEKFSLDTVKTIGQLTNQFGLTNDEASEFVKLSRLSGKETSDTTLTLKTQIQALKERENIAISEKDIMQEIAKSSAAQQLTFRGSSKSLAEAAFHAKKLGLSLAQTEAIGSSLLDFESSIANEMEAELMLGRDLNLERARSAALQGDLATVAKEVAGQIGSAAEFGKMNVLQQEALAKSVGVSRDELAGMLKTQELLAGTGFNDMNQAQEEFRKLLKETGSEEAALAKLREGGASDALADQIRVVSLQEKRRQQEREIAEAQGQLAKNALKLFSAFNKVLAAVKRVKAVVVDQMKPFFDEFSGLIGEGGSTFEEKLIPPAKMLGKFLNDVGIRLINAIKNIDVDALTQKVKNFVQNIKDAFNFIKEQVKAFSESSFAQFLSGNASTISLAVAPLAIKGLGKGLFKRGSKMNPMFVKQSDSNIFDKALGKRNTGLLKGLKGLSKITGGKGTMVGRGLRNVAAMAGKRSSIGSQILKGAGSKVLGGLGKVGVKGLVKAIPGVGLIATAGMAAVDAFKGFQNAGEIFNKKVGESVSMGEKLAAGAASAVSGLTFGLLDTKKTAMAFKNAGTATKEFFSNMGSGIVNVSEGIFDFVKNAGKNIKEGLSNAFTKVIDKAKELFTKGVDFIKGIFSPIIDFFLNMFKTPINALIGALNSVISGINSALTLEIPDWVPVYGGSTFSPGLPTVPLLAEGGIVENPTLAVIGEQGPEAVIPLDKLSSTVGAETSSQNVDELKQELQELKQIMAGFVEQMGQVVNRPITVELNGNKVGQALGQNSYRIQ